MDNNKRRFQRIPFDAQIQLDVTNRDEKAIIGRLEDISLKGALISVDQNQAALAVGDTATLAIEPEGADFALNLTVEVAYALSAKMAYGLNLLSLDVQSAEHLRRLVELNLGDESSLQRELSNLIEAMEAEHTPS